MAARWKEACRQVEEAEQMRRVRREQRVQEREEFRKQVERKDREIGILKGELKEERESGFDLMGVARIREGVRGERNMAYEREIGEFRAKMKKMKQDLKLSVRQSAERYGEGTVLKREAQL